MGREVVKAWPDCSKMRQEAGNSAILPVFCVASEAAILYKGNPHHNRPGTMSDTPEKKSSSQAAADPKVWRPGGKEQEHADSIKPAIKTGNQSNAGSSGLPLKKEIGGREGPEPVRYGDWEKNGRCIDF